MSNTEHRTIKRAVTFRDRIGRKFSEFKTSFLATWNDETYSENMGTVIDMLAAVTAVVLMLLCIAYAYVYDFLNRNIIGRLSWTLASGSAVGWSVYNLYAVADLRIAGQANNGHLLLAWGLIIVALALFLYAPLVREEIRKNAVAHMRAFDDKWR